MGDGLTLLCSLGCSKILASQFYLPINSTVPGCLLSSHVVKFIISLFYDIELAKSHLCFELHCSYWLRASYRIFACIILVRCIHIASYTQHLYALLDHSSLDFYCCITNLLTILSLNFLLYPSWRTPSEAGLVCQVNFVLWSLHLDLDGCYLSQQYLLQREDLPSKHSSNLSLCFTQDEPSECHSQGYFGIINSWFIMTGNKTHTSLMISIGCLLILH